MALREIIFFIFYCYLVISSLFGMEHENDFKDQSPNLEPLCFNSLPKEIKFHIFSFFTFDEFLPTRLTCKDFNDFYLEPSIQFNALIRQTKLRTLPNKHVRYPTGCELSWKIPIQPYNSLIINVFNKAPHNRNTAEQEDNTLGHRHNTYLNSLSYFNDIGLSDDQIISGTAAALFKDSQYVKEYLGNLYNVAAHAFLESIGNKESVTKIKIILREQFISCIPVNLIKFKNLQKIEVDVEDETKCPWISNQLKSLANLVTASNDVKQKTTPPSVDVYADIDILDYGELFTF